MAQVILLGTGSAWSGPKRENTFMLVRGDNSNILIDCAGSPAQRLALLRISPADINHVILTHNHPDHIYGLPIFMLNAWMAGRRSPMDVYGLPETLRSARALLRAVDVKAFPQFFKINYHAIRPNSIAPILSVDGLEITGSRAVHFVPTLAVRITNHASGQSIAYSADTSPQADLSDLACNVKYFLHEATTLDKSTEGHSSALEAGEQATKAHAKSLILLHLPPQVSPTKWRAAAKKNFHGGVHIASDFDSFEF